MSTDVTVTFNATTKVWSRTDAGIISYPSTVSEVAGGPFLVVPVTVPFDPIHQTGGAFYELKAGPHVGFLVSAFSNSLGYGNITINQPVDPTQATQGIAKIDPLADWRVLIKAMGGPGGKGGRTELEVNATTQLWSRTTTGIISWPSTRNAAPGGPYWVNPIVVPFDPIHQTGGSFYELKEGPDAGFLVSFHTNALGYGDISTAQGDFNRGPGETLATIYHPNPHTTGASKHYNAGGEFHMSLLVDDPNILVPLPKQTHYAVEFFDIDANAWVEVFAGMIWDMDANEKEVIFYGIDYLALYQFVVDSRFNVAEPDAEAPTGSKYNDQTISAIIQDELQYAHDQTDSMVGWIDIGPIATMPINLSIYATFVDVLSFVKGLLDSWRAGSGKFSEIAVVKTGDGTYSVQTYDDPGVARDNLLLQYGNLVQAYRVIPFGKTWYDRVNVIGRDLFGVKAQFKSLNSSLSQSTWGQIAGPPIYFDALDDNDILRRALQASIDASRLGKQIGVDTRLGSWRPWEGYNLLDRVPIDINHGAVQTKNYGNDIFGADPAGDPSGVLASYWAIIGLLWEAYDDGHWVTTPLLWPAGKGVLADVCSYKEVDVGGASTVDAIGDTWTVTRDLSDTPTGVNFHPGGTRIPESGTMVPTGHTLTGVRYDGAPIGLVGTVPNDGTLFGIGATVTGSAQEITARWSWDLGVGSQGVCSVGIVSSGSIEGHLQVQGSDDGVTWVTVLTNAHITADSLTAEAALVPVDDSIPPYRYWALFYDAMVTEGLAYYPGFQIVGILFWARTLAEVSSD